MVRRWLVRPDQMMFVEGVGEVPFVSRQAMQEAFLDAEAITSRLGGHVSVSTDRHPTGFPGEMVTTAAAFLWRDRTDAKEQPEHATPVEAPEPERTTGGTVHYARQALSDPEPEPLQRAQAFEYETTLDEGDAGEVTPEMHDPGAGLPSHDDIDDGLDPSTLEEEDFDSVPESAR